VFDGDILPENTTGIERLLVLQELVYNSDIRFYFTQAIV
jgi:hypothetical protein